MSHAYVDKFFLALLLGASSLVFEDDIVVPPSFHVEGRRIEQRVAHSNVLFTLFLFLRSLLRFLQRSLATQ